MTNQITLTIKPVWPWWRDLYFRALYFKAWCGLPVDVERAASFLVRHTRIRVV